MKMRFILSTLSLMVITGHALAGEMVLVSDEELDSVYAQGLGDDAVIYTTDSIDPSLLGDNPTVIQFPEQMGLSGEVIIGDNAQQNAFNPVNAANSAVSNVYNIFVIIESNWENVNVNINNNLETINSSNIMGASY